MGEGGHMATRAEGTDAIFVRRSSGLTRQIGTWDALAYAALVYGPQAAFVYIVYGPAFFQDANMVLAVPAVLLMFPIAALYWYFSVLMPRSGGEYIYISRGLTPGLGLWSSFMITGTTISFAGVLTSWWIKWGLNDGIRAIGIVRQDAGFVSLADSLDNPWIRLAIASVSLLLVWYMLMRGARRLITLNRIGYAAALGCLVLFGIMVMSVGREGVVENFNRLSGSDYQTVLEAGREAGALFKWTILGTFFVGFTYIAENTLGSTFSANVAGEIRGVQRSQAVALFGSLFLAMAYWAIAYALFHVGFGRDFIHSMDALWLAGSEAYPPAFQHAQATGEPIGTLYFAFLTSSPILIGLFAVLFTVAWWCEVVGLAFTPVRNIFAWAFDRLLPAKFAELGTRWKAPWVTVTLVVLVAYVFVVFELFYPVLLTGVLYSLVTWFLGWMILGVAGIVFPYRRRQIFESGPPSIQRRLLGIPLLSWFGLGTAVASGFVNWIVLKPFLDGAVEWAAMIPVLPLAVIPIVLYGIANVYHRRRGLPLSLQFSTVPPE